MQWDKSSLIISFIMLVTMLYSTVHRESKAGAKMISYTSIGEGFIHGQGQLRTTSFASSVVVFWMPAPIASLDFLQVEKELLLKNAFLLYNSVTIQVRSLGSWTSCCFSKLNTWAVHYFDLRIFLPAVKAPWIFKKWVVLHQALAAELLPPMNFSRF